MVDGENDGRDLVEGIVCCDGQWFLCVKWFDRDGERVYMGHH